MGTTGVHEHWHSWPPTLLTNTHIFRPATFTLCFEQLILPASTVDEWITDHIYLKFLIFNLSAIFSPQNKFNYFQSHIAKLPYMKGYCICVMTSNCTAWSAGGNFPVLVPITGQCWTAILQYSLNYYWGPAMPQQERCSWLMNHLHFEIIYFMCESSHFRKFYISQIFTASEVSWPSTCIYGYGHCSCLQVSVSCSYVGHL
jgi:hypothetical protein